MTDTAWKHLYDLVAPANKDKPLSEATKIYIKREQEAIEAGKKEPTTIFDMLRAAVEAKGRGETLKIKLVNQSLDLESEPAKKEVGAFDAVRVAEVNNLGGAFQYQGMLFGEAMKGSALQVTNFIGAIKEAFKEANSEAKMNLAFKAMKKVNKILVARLEDREAYIETLQKELSKGFAREKTAHIKDMKTLTDKHFLERQVKELEMMLDQYESTTSDEETTKEEAELEKNAIDEMVEQVEGMIGKAPKYMETVDKAKTLIGMAKGLLTPEKDTEKKEGDKKEENPASS